MISPSSLLASKIAGASKTKVAMPLDPSLLRVSLTSGIVGSSTPARGKLIKEVWLDTWLKLSRNFTWVYCKYMVHKSEDIYLQ